jgi:hypothetical protein
MPRLQLSRRPGGNVFFGTVLLEFRKGRGVAESFSTGPADFAMSAMRA